MPVHLADSLLALATSIDGDGGHEVCRILASLLRDAAPFDAGEVVLRQEEGFHRFPFGADEREVAGKDLVCHVLRSGAPLRLDDSRDLEVYPETRERMAEAGLKSALALPLGILLHVQAPPHGAAANGILVLARRHGWAFVGASLNLLGPLAAMAGLALDRSLSLTALGHPGREATKDADRRRALPREGASLVAELQELRAGSDAQKREVASLQKSLAQARADLADSRGAAIAAQSALDQALNRCHELQARLDRLDAVPPAPAPADAPAAPPEPESAAVAAPAPPPAEDTATAPEVSVPGPPLVAVSAPAGGPSSRRPRRRRRGAFEPTGGAGTP